MTTWEFFKAWLALNMALCGLLLVTNILLVNATGRPLNIVVPGFTQSASASEWESPKHKR